MVFLNQQAVITYLGPKANKFVAYSVASISGAILAGGAGKNNINDEDIYAIVISIKS